MSVRDSVWVDWIHPSYRDLVIDELSADEELAQAFLSRMSREGVKLALSSTGGSDGTRALPLLRSADAWRTLDKRLLELIETMNQKQLAELLVAITIEAAHTANQSILKQNWSDLLTVVLASVLSGWDTNKVLIEPETLEAFVAATTFTVPLIAVPDLQATWAQAYDDFLKASQELDIEKIDRFVRIATVAKNNEPRFLDQQDFPSDDALNAFEKILETIESERAERQREMGERVGPDGIPYYEMPYDDPEELSGLGFEFEGYATTCWRIARLKLPLDGDPESLDSACTEIASELNDMAGALAAEGFADMYQDSYHEARLEHEHASSFSVDGLFSDL